MKLKKGVALLLASAAMVSLAGCGGNSGGSGSNASNAAGGSSELPTLRVAAMPTITSLPTYYIQKNGLDEKAGFKMEVTMFDTGAPMNEALAADLWDVGQMGAAAVTGMANYDELIIGEVLESTDGQGVFVSPDCPVAQDTGFNPSIPTVLGSPESVSGITILTPVGTAQHFTVLKWLEKLGMEPVYFMVQPQYFRGIYTIMTLWQNAGFNALVFIAAIMGIDPQLYEAATVDGAGKWQKIKNITVPAILPTIVTMLVLNIGKMVKVGYEAILLLYQPSTFAKADIIATYSYRLGFENGNYGLATAVGMFEAIVALVLVTLANRLSRKLSDTALW